MTGSVVVEAGIALFVVAEQPGIGSVSVPDSVAAVITSNTPVGVTLLESEQPSVIVGGFGPTGQRGENGPEGPTGPIGSPMSFSVPAVASYTISHMLGRYALSPTFYDAFGQECVVGFESPDLLTLVITQESPVGGTVVFA